MNGFNWDQTRRSKITFITNNQSEGSIDFGDLRRVREPVNRSKSGVQGKIADTFLSRSRHARSQNEIKGFRVLLATGRADAWQEQPFILEYHHDGQKQRYIPDILVVWGAYREVVEIKEDSEADLSENQERFAFIRECLADHNFHFRVWKKSEICAENRLTNVGLVLRYRCVNVSPIEHEVIRRRFSSSSEFRLGALCKNQGISIESVLRLVLDGTLHINWWEPLTLDSLISREPTGPQRWPSPLYCMPH